MRVSYKTVKECFEVPSETPRLVYNRWYITLGKTSILRHFANERCDKLRDDLSALSFRGCNVTFCALFEEFSIVSPSHYASNSNFF
jgi:hypothetical protein